MPICINEAKADRRIRYELKEGQGSEFHLTGEYVELVSFSKIVQVQRMHLPDPTPDNHVEMRFDADGLGTPMTMRTTLPNAQTRTRMLAIEMEHGMDAGYVTPGEVAVSCQSLWQPRLR